MNCLSRQTTYSCSYKMKREQPYDLGDCSEGIPLPIYPLLSNTSTLLVLDLGRVVDRRVRCQAINKTNVCQELRVEQSRARGLLSWKLPPTGRNVPRKIIIGLYSLRRIDRSPRRAPFVHSFEQNRARRKGSKQPLCFDWNN
jgi:hypothetical protein